MKKTYITAGLLLSLTLSYAQNKHTEKADRLFNTYQYVDAAEAYLTLAQSKNADHYIYKQLADSYYVIYNMEEASKWYAKAIEKKQDSETYYKYAQALKSQGKYKEANQQMEQFAALASNDQRAKEFKRLPDYLPTLQKQKNLFKVAKTSINSADQADFAPMLSNDNILYFVSSRNTKKKLDKWSNQPYLDIYQATRNADGSLTNVELVNDLNTVFHDGPITMSQDGNTIFFARDSHSEGSFEKDKKNKVKLGQQGIYKATKVNGKWSNIEALPINSTKYSVGNPSLSQDGNTLYFTSNMPGGLGETDIWKISVQGNNYGTPQNLGAKVNTSARETFPFISDNNTLYFSSNGWTGFGGLDIFKANLKDNSEPINLGQPMNTSKDDFSFSMNEKLGVAFFASNRDGIDNIYQANPICEADAIATIKDKNTNKPIANAEVKLLDGKMNIIASNQTNASGQVTFDIDCETDYIIQSSKSNFETASTNVSKVKSGSTNIDLSLEPIEVVITDKEILLENVYFEYNQSNITNQGAAELDKLVRIMKNQSNLVIFVKSHTDTKGKAAYNLDLSEKRAQATVQYVISKGISKDRISGKGFGLTEPKVVCKSCTTEQDAQNRRSEFLIIKK